ncbi:MAG: HEPN domain-containing protein [Candidatus Planktophila sp.]|nr:HEPN domain-containing protein [Candidatus Planktophila sp.]
MEITEESARLTKKYLSKKLIEEIEIDINQAHQMIAQAENHLRSAMNALVDDKEGAYVLLYDAARKGLTAILYLQGIRPTAYGGHSIILNVLIPQCSTSEVALIRPFNRLRKIRNSVEYPRTDFSEIDETSLREDFNTAVKIVKWAKSTI